MKIFKLTLGLFVCCLIINSCSQKIISYDVIFAPYKNSKKPMPFAPELWLNGNVFKGCFGNDYSTFYFFRYLKPNSEDYRIYQSTFKGSWGDIKEVSFSDSSSDLYPMTSAVEENRMLFISYRRTPSDTSKKPNANFWYTTKTNNGWEYPTPFVEANLIYNYNSQPCITSSGNIYFTSDLPDWSKTLTYKMEYRNGSYQNPRPFDFVNQLRSNDTTKTFWEICVSPDEKYMIMTISEKGKEARLYVSFINSDKWSNPTYIGEIIKEDMSGNFPYITKDGNFLIFTKEFSSIYIIPTNTFVKESNE